MNRLISIILFFILSLTIRSEVSEAQNWQWARTANGIGDTMLSNYCHLFGMAADDSGNVYVAAENAYRELICGNDTFQTYGDGGPVLVKYNAQGSARWIVSQNDSGVALPSGVATDHFNNVFMAGTYLRDSICFGSYTLYNGYPKDSFTWEVGGNFLVKFTQQGKVKWAKKIGDFTLSVTSITTNAEGSVFVAGYYYRPVVQLDSVILTNSNPSVMQSYYVKYDSSGNLLWAGSLNGDDFDVSVRDITTDKQGNFYLAAHCNATNIYLDGVKISNPNNNRMIVAKFNSSGGIIWIKSSIGATWRDFCLPYSIAVDDSCNVYLTGYYEGSVTLGSHQLPEPPYDASFFLAKYTPSGNVAWVKAATNGVGYSVAVDSTGNIYVSGECKRKQMKFDSTTIQLSTLKGQPMFIVQYNRDGSFNCVTTTSSGGYEKNEVAVGGNNEIYVGGTYFWGEVIVGKDTLKQDTEFTIVAEQVFVARLEACEDVSAVEEQTAEPLQVNIYPNPADKFINIKLNPQTLKADTEFILFNSIGEKVMHLKLQKATVTLSIAGLTPGLYTGKVTSGGNPVTVHKIVVMH